MTARSVLILLGATTVCLAAPWGTASPLQPPTPTAAAQAEDGAFRKQVDPFLRKYCIDCHSGDKPKAGLSLDVYQSELHARKDRKNWGAIQHALAAGDMPPPKKAQPTKAEREFVINWIETTLTKVDCGGPQRPRPRHDPAAQPHRVQQHHPRPLRRGLQAGRGVSLRRRGLRLRQHRRRSLLPAGLAREVPDRGRQSVGDRAQDRGSAEEFEAALPPPEHQCPTAERQVARPRPHRLHDRGVGDAGEVQFSGRGRLHDPHPSLGDQHR